MATKNSNSKNIGGAKGLANDMKTVGKIVQNAHNMLCQLQPRLPHTHRDSRKTKNGKHVINFDLHLHLWTEADMSL